MYHVAVWDALTEPITYIEGIENIQWWTQDMIDIPAGMGGSGEFGVKFFFVGI